VITDSQIIKRTNLQLNAKAKSWKMRMDKVRLILTLVTIAIVIIPIVGMLLAYQGNFLGLFIPPEIADYDIESTLEPPKIVGEPEYDEATRTFSVSFEYTNSLPIDITINSLSGNIGCNEHYFPLGAANLSEPASIDIGETRTLTIIGTWTDDAIGHFENMHGNEETVAVFLMDFAVNISGIQIELDQNQLDQGMEVPNPAFQG
jgi:hypothetical protein